MNDEKTQLVTYLASLAAILNLKEDTGRDYHIQVIAKEWDDSMKRLLEIMDEDQKNDAGRRTKK